MNIFITGKPGCGKSTLINEIIEELKKHNKKIAGIITPEIRKNNSRYGFKIIDLVTKKATVMASIDIKPAKVSKYGVSIENIDKIIDVFLESYDKSDYIFIDEIGKMEFFSEKFKETLNKILLSNKIAICALGLAFLNKFKNKGTTIFLEKQNFNNIKNQILEKIK